MVANDGRDGNRQPVPSSDAREREAQDRASGRSGEASSPVDAKHVDAPTEQDNARGHRKAEHLKE